MSTYCAVSLQFSEACWRNDAWHGTIIDPPPKAKPKGFRATTAHHKLWVACSGARVQDWMWSRVTFLLNGRWEPWQWRRSMWQSCRGHRVLISRQPVSLSNVNARFEIKHDDSTTEMVFGLSDSECPVELMCLLLNKKDRQQRGPKPSVDVDLNFYYVGLGAASRKKCLGWNGRMLSADTASPPLATLDGAIVTFGVKGSRLVASACKKTPFQLEGRLPCCAVVRSDYPHYAVVIATGDEKPGIEITPFLNTKKLVITYHQSW